MLHKGRLANNSTVSRSRSFTFNKVTTRTKLEEQILLKRLSQGDISAFWELWRWHQGYLYSRCLSWMAGNHADAEEALSRATLKAWSKLPKYAGTITNSKAWLTRLTHNLCIDIHRERNRGARGVESIEDIPVAACEAIATSSESPESTLLRREMNLYIRRAVDSLPPRLRQPFILRYYRQMSYTDIAKQLALSNANVRKRMQQAREILQKQLKHYLSGLENSPASISPLPSLKKAKPDGASPSVLPEKVLAWKEPKSDESAPSDSRTLITMECILQPINYKVTATCLESLPHAWYSSPSRLGWK